MKKIIFIVLVLAALVVFNVVHDRSADFIKSGMARLEQADYQGAYDDFNQAIEIDPNYAEAYAGRARAKTMLGDLDGAITDFTSALLAYADYRLAHNNPAYADAFIGRGAVRSKLGQYSAAQDDFTRALEIDPDSVAAYSSRGFAHTRLGDYAAAREDFTAAIGRAPENALLYYNRGAVYLWLEDPARACSDWKRARDLGHAAAHEVIRQHCE